MRRPLDEKRVRAFLHELALASDAETRVYLTGGATAVLYGWRPSTVDVDLKIVPENDAILRAIPRLKEEMQLNVELASPDDFIPELPGWQERSPFIEREQRVSFHHYDPYAQALAKLERSQPKDLLDVREMLGRGLILPAELRRLFLVIEPRLYRFPSIDEKSFRRAVENALAEAEGKART
ncbi:MAG TPA: DUF6036 family nucleotidyltransferase [Thermoanaerobaculia bacterium]|nr:DUF6036 family nucleotidyltransferase [Thermoanaerobaculia bacterium]